MLGVACCFNMGASQPWPTITRGSLRCLKIRIKGCKFFWGTSRFTVKKKCLKGRFKAWGFSNFSVYITKDQNDPLLTNEETGRKKTINGKVFFTDDVAQAGYINPEFRLEGVFRKIANNEE